MPICNTCKNATAWYKDHPDLAWAKSDFIAEHDQCEYPTTCTCQHRLDAVKVIDVRDDQAERQA